MGIVHWVPKQSNGRDHPEPLPEHAGQREHFALEAKGGKGSGGRLCICENPKGLMKNCIIRDNICEFAKLKTKAF